MISVGARNSPLSRAQVREVWVAMQQYKPTQFLMTWVDTRGDRDKKTSLRSLVKTDFFTRELDEMVREEKIRIAVHSAKDLPDPLPAGLSLIALTRGIDSRDALVLRSGETLRVNGLIATSSERREEAARSLQPNLRFSDLRGTIAERLAKLETGEADGIVVAEAALIRLQLTHLNRIYLPGPTAEGQGKLAIVARETDLEAKELFSWVRASSI